MRSRQFPLPAITRVGPAGRSGLLKGKDSKSSLLIKFLHEPLSAKAQSGIPRIEASVQNNNLFGSENAFVPKKSSVELICI